ncbi:MAG: hypothetical protein KDJ76_16410, partial [Xanthobacteraceae bacterium]|nr:hypothetical protein [Xanthobacteraceae bacterium]
MSAAPADVTPMASKAAEQRISFFTTIPIRLRFTPAPEIRPQSGTAGARYCWLNLRLKEEDGKQQRKAIAALLGVRPGWDAIRRRLLPTDHSSPGGNAPVGPIERHRRKAKPARR